MLAAASVQVDVQFLALLVGTVIPLVTGFVTKAAAPAWVKAWVTLVLSATAGALAPVIAAQGHLVWQQFGYSILLAVLAAGAAHHGVWKPIGASNVVRSLAPSWGLGTPESVKKVAPRRRVTKRVADHRE